MPLRDKASLERNCAEHLFSRSLKEISSVDNATMLADRAMPGVMMMSARFVAHAFTPHFHEELMIGIISEGVKTFRRDRLDHFAPPGTVSIVNPGDVHTGRRALGEHLVYSALYIPWDFVQQILVESDRANSQPGFKQAVLTDPLIFAALSDYCASLRNSEFRLERETQLRRSILALVDRHALKSEPSERAGDAKTALRIREWLHSKQHESPSISALSHDLAMSPCHLIRAFKRHFGIPPHAYLIHLKIEVAKRHLARGIPASVVATEVGFADQAHMTRHFKRAVGLAPAKYQRAFIPRLAD